MRTLIWLPAAFLAGIVIGAWGPREEIRALKENQHGSGSDARNAADGFQAFARLASIPEEAKRPHRRKGQPKPLFRAATNNPPAMASDEAKAAAPSHDPESSANAVPRRPERISPEDLRARIEEAQDLWRTRAELAMAQWKDKLNLSGSAANQFDAAIAGMNEQLYDAMQAMAELLSRQERLTPELGLRMMGEATAIMVDTYEKIGACLPADRRAEASGIQVFDFIDPGVAEPLIPVQDKLNGMNARGAR